MLCFLFSFLCCLFYVSCKVAAMLLFKCPGMICLFTFYLLCAHLFLIGFFVVVCLFVSGNARCALALARDNVP